jgi:hypothetical protein
MYTIESMDDDDDLAMLPIPASMLTDENIASFVLAEWSLIAKPTFTKATGCLQFAHQAANLCPLDWKDSKAHPE